MDKEQKKVAKKERRKRQARTKTIMETIRTCCSMGALTLAALSLLHTYKLI